MGNIIGFLFKKIKSTPSHISFKFLGINIHFLKPEIRKERKRYSEYYQSFSDPTLIPVAEGGLRLVQKANAELLSTFQDICKEHNLLYWIDFGTLLGAIRHKGFIPWDDDIDLGMPRDDYEKLIELFSKGFPNNEDLVLDFENNGKNKCFVKISHKKSENLFLDIFPYDFYHSQVSSEEKDVLSEKIVEARNTKKYPSIKKSIEFMRTRFKNITQEIILENKQINKSIKPALFMGIDFPHNWKNKVYNWEDIFPLREISFENKTFVAPNMPEEVLKSIYGDYLKIPKNCYPRHSNYSKIPKEEKAFLEGLIK